MALRFRSHALNHLANADFADLTDCLSCFVALETLEVTDVLGGASTHVGLTCKSNFLTALLDSVPADSPFRFLHLHLLSYSDPRTSPLFDDVLTDGVRSALRRFSGLGRFDLTVECETIEQDVVEDVTLALKQWLSESRLPVQVRCSMATPHGAAMARWTCCWTPSSQLAATERCQHASHPGLLHAPGSHEPSHDQRRTCLSKTCYNE